MIKKTQLYKLLPNSIAETNYLNGQKQFYQSFDPKINRPHQMDQSHINQNFELNKSRQNLHHSLKEHHKISNIPKFRFEML